jgi:hypothetical protein
MKRSKSKNLILIGLFVDDILISYSREDEEEWKEMKESFMSKYKMKDLGDAKWVLGMNITRERKNEKRKLILDQQRYIEKILKEFNMDQSRPMETPEEAGTGKLTKQDCAETREEKENMKDKPYMSMVGSLLYASISTRPDISHAVSVASRFMKTPGEKHWKAAKRTLRYLQGTTQFGLEYEAEGDVEDVDIKTPLEVVGYCDADWAGDVDDRKSTTGYVIKINGCTISWLSKKQGTVALSTAEAEYMSISSLVQELKWFHQVLTELEIPHTIPMRIYTDNQAAKAISENDLHHQRTKHIDLRHHFVRDAVAAGEVKIEWIQSENQLADVFTKGLNKQTYKRLTQSIMTTLNKEK